MPSSDINVFDRPERRFPSSGKIRSLLDPADAESKVQLSLAGLLRRGPD